MDSPNRYYLFKAGKLIGPVSAKKIEEMRQSKAILQYSWMMDEQTQKWAPVDAMPKENPFEATLTSLKERSLSGAFIYRDSEFSGHIKGLHSFGVEILIPHGNRAIHQLQNNSVHLLNIVDETHLKSANTEVLYQGEESTADGTLLRFQWKDMPSPLQN